VPKALLSSYFRAKGSSQRGIVIFCLLFKAESLRGGISDSVNMLGGEPLNIKVISKLLVFCFVLLVCFFKFLRSLGVLIKIRFRHLNTFLKPVLNSLWTGRRIEVGVFFGKLKQIIPISLFGFILSMKQGV